MSDFTEIMPHIFIGSRITAVGNPQTKENDLLEPLDIKVVISALSEEEYERYQITQEDFDTVTWYRLVISDDEDENIYQHFAPVSQIISEAIKENKNVLIHCSAGISRSPTLVIAHLMIEKNWSYEDAYRHIKSRRNFIEPNEGFVIQLRMLQFQLIY
jgi:protein-tyrosine phosphatase